MSTTAGFASIQAKLRILSNFGGKYLGNTSFTRDAEATRGKGSAENWSRRVASESRAPRVFRPFYYIPPKLETTRGPNTGLMQV